MFSLIPDIFGNNILLNKPKKSRELSTTPQISIWISQPSFRMFPKE